MRTGKLEWQTIAQLTSLVTVDLDIQGYRDTVTFLVMPMSRSFDLILGNDWFLRRQAVISYKSFSLCISHKGKNYVLKAKDITYSLFPSVQSPKSTDIDTSQPQTFLLTQAKAKRAIRKRSQCFVLEMHYVQGSHVVRLRR